MRQPRDAADDQNGKDHGTAKQQPKRDLSASDFIHDMSPGNGKRVKGANYMPFAALLEGHAGRDHQPQV
jgi:hypothetical protein